MQAVIIDNEKQDFFTIAPENPRIINYVILFN